MRVAIYVRVSSERQADSGLGIDAQLSRCRDYCAFRQGCVVVCEIVDDKEGRGQSARAPLNKREGGRRLLELVHRGEIDGIVALRLDRVFRRTAECIATVESWNEHRISLHLVDFGGQALDTRSAAGKMMLSVMAVVAQFESEIAGERTAAALKQAQIQGKRIGRAAFGFANAVRFQEDGTKIDAGVWRQHPDEQRAVERILELSRFLKKRDGQPNNSAIARHLQKEGVATRNGGTWTHVQVGAVLDGDRNRMMIRCLTKDCRGALHRTGAQFPMPTPVDMLHCCDCLGLFADKGDGRADEAPKGAPFTTWSADEAARYCATCREKR